MKTPCDQSDSHNNHLYVHYSTSGKGHFSVQNNLGNGYSVHLKKNITMVSNPDNDKWMVNIHNANNNHQGSYVVASPDDYKTTGGSDDYNSKANISMDIYDKNNLVSSCSATVTYKHTSTENQAKVVTQSCTNGYEINGMNGPYSTTATLYVGRS